MTELDRQPGLCVAYGGTNARVADILDGTPVNFRKDDTPTNPDEFFGLIGTNIVQAHSKGANWAVLGFPGPVKEDGNIIGPFSNINGLQHHDAYDLYERIGAANEEARSLIDSGFKVIAVNDGELAAQAVASSQEGAASKAKIGALIIGTGVGLGVVRPEKFDGNTVFLADLSNPYEFGHLAYEINDFPSQTIASVPSTILKTFENTFSGPALAQSFGAKDFEKMLDKLRQKGIDVQKHPAIQRLAQGIVVMANNFGPAYGVEIVAATGGVGIGAIEDYRDAYLAANKAWLRGANKLQKDHKPEVVLLEGENPTEFEMKGALAVVHSRIAVSKMALPPTLNTNSTDNAKLGVIKPRTSSELPDAPGGVHN